MNIYLYIVIALLAGVVVTYLLMRLRSEKLLAEQVRINDRRQLELQASQEEARRLNDELVQARNVNNSLEMELSAVNNNHIRLQAEKRALEQHCDKLVTSLDEAARRNNSLQNDVADARQQYVQLQAEYKALKEKLETQKEELDRMHKLMLSEFKVMASDIMDEKNKAFKEMSGESLKSILEPLNKDIDSFRKQVAQCYDVENKERSSLQEQIRQLAEQNEKMRREADKLSSALRGGTKVQGDWGEMILYNILQQSGLREGVDYEIQKSVNAEGDNKRPDAILHFPHHNDLIIDSKVSFTAYDNYMNARTEEEQRHYARQHLESVNNHIRQLGERNYAGRNKDSYDFVVMFIPIESMFLLALDEARTQGRNLWNEAYERRIIIMTPTNLVLAVRLLQDMWRQQRLEANIRAIKERAEKMYTQFVSFATDIDAVRQSLDAAVASCESARHRLMRGNDNLILQFEKMRQLGLEPKVMSKAAVQKSWKLMQDEAGVSDAFAGDDTEPSSLPPSTPVNQ